MEYYNRANIIALCLISILSSHTVLASNNDNYIKLLESEAVETRLDQGSGLNQKNVPKDAVSNVSVRALANKEWHGECDYVKDTVSSDVIEEEFHSFVKQCAMGTFIYYRQLDFNSKHSVYKNYKLSIPMRLKTLRENILSYF